MFTRGQGQLAGILIALLFAAAGATGAGLWDDRPVRVMQTVDMHFPPSLLFEGITQGSVRVVLEIDADGKLTDFLVTGFTRPELAAELQRALPTFEFQPAHQRGVPIGTRSESNFMFEARGTVLSLSPISAAGAQFNVLPASMTMLLARSTDLDHPMKALHRVNPMHPGRILGPNHSAGKAQLDFYIDGEGRPRMPVALRATHEAFAAAAVDALLQWRFERPTHQGRAVIVRVVMEFVFPATAGTAASD